MEFPLQAYRGDEPYVFVCYAHDDKALVYPEIRWLQGLGVHVWYDEGISPGEEWSEELGRAIDGANWFLYFVTPNSVASRNCRNELHFAHGHEKSIICVHLEPTRLPVGLELMIGSSQAILEPDNAGGSYRARLVTVLQVDAHSTSADQAKPARELPGRGVDASLPYKVSIDSFEALGAAPETRQLMRNLVDGVGLELSRSSAIRVVVSAGERFAGSRAPVDYVLKGAIGLSEGHANASIQLVSTTDRQLVWAESFDASASAASTKVPIWGKQIARMVGAMIPLHQQSRFLSTDDQIAISHFLGALGQFVRQAQGGAENWGLIARSYERAARQDPAFFEAHTGLAGVYANRLGLTISADEALPNARAAIDRALQLAPGNETALVIRGQIQQSLELDYASARQSYDLAQEAGAPPSVIDYHVAVNHLFQGQFEEAIVRFDAARTAGVGFDQVVTLWQMGVALDLVGDYQAALNSFREAISSASERGTLAEQIRLDMARLMYRLGDRERANDLVSEAWGRIAQRKPELFLPAFAEMGWREEARELVDRLEKKFTRGEFVPAMRMFPTYYHLDEHERALAWLSRAIEDRQGWLIMRLRSTRFEGIRSDPRFAAAMLRLEEIEAAAASD